MTLVLNSDQTLADLRRREPSYVAAIMGSPRLDQLGAGDYYMLRLRNNALIPEPEWHVLKYMLENFPIESTIVEIGCGWGQVLAMASAVGYGGVGIDLAAGRLEGARNLRDIVDADFAGVAGRLEFFETAFPDKWDKALEHLTVTKRGPVVGFFSNLGYGATEEYCDACVEEFRHFDYVIMDILRFFSNRLELEVQNAFIEKMKAFGIYYLSDIFHRPGSYRFIALSVDHSRLPPMKKKLEPGEAEDPVFAWIAAVLEAGGSVSAERAVLVDRLVRELKECGAWQRLDRLWMFAAENEAQALVDLVRCGRSTAVNDPSFFPNWGYAFDGGTQYIDTGFNAANAPLAKYSQTSASFGGYVFAPAERLGGVEFGNDFGAYSMLVTNYGDRRRFQVSASTDSGNYPANGVFTGHFHGQRTASDHTELFLNGVSQGSSSDVCSRVANQTFFVGAGRGSGGASNHSDASISTAHVGCRFSHEEIVRFDEVIRSFLTFVTMPQR